MISLRLIPMRIHADIIRLRSLYHVFTHMISLRLIPMRIHADIIRLRSLYHVFTHMISLRLIPMRIRADIIRLRSLYHIFNLGVTKLFAQCFCFRQIFLHKCPESFIMAWLKQMSKLMYNNIFHTFLRCLSKCQIKIQMM